MFLAIWIENPPKLSRVGSVMNASKRLVRVSRWHIGKRQINAGIVERIFEDKIYSDHGSPLPESQPFSIPVRPVPGGAPHGGCLSEEAKTTRELALLGSTKGNVLRGVRPEQSEVLRFAQNDSTGVRLAARTGCPQFGSAPT